jgi:hypothetical protein
MWHGLRWGGEGRGVYGVFVWRPEDIGGMKMDLREIGIDGVNWIGLVRDRVKWRAFVNTVMNPWVP